MFRAHWLDTINLLSEHIHRPERTPSCDFILRESERIHVPAEEDGRFSDANREEGNTGRMVDRATQKE